MKTTASSPRLASSRPCLPLTAISARTTLWSLLAGLAFPLPVAALVALLPLPHDSAALAAATGRMTQLFLHPSSIALFALAAFPLVEEIFYRGLLFNLFRRFLPLPIAMAIPTFFFAATHLGQGLNTALFALCAGGFFNWLALRSRSLLPAMLCHSAVNLAWLFVFTPILVAHDIASPAAFAQPLPLLLCTASLALLIAALAILRREFQLSAPAALRDTVALPAAPQLA